MNPIEKYNSRAKKINSLLCVGLDSDFEKIPDKFRQMEFPQFEFNKYIIGETHEFAAAYKPNIAFYEACGDKGIKELKMTMEFLQKNHPEIFTICDAKRADIGNTNNGYVTSIFDWYGFDAVTISPYLGQEAVQPFLNRTDKASIVLCRTSNPGAGEFQDLQSSGRQLWQIVAENVTKKWNNNNCMLVVGATYPAEMKKVRAITGDMTFLVPGIGAQGGSVEEVMKAGLNREGLGLIINSSRGIIFAADPKAEARKLSEEIRKYKV
jgi:orotidine-5'-phosphate decarboxylase